MRSRVEDAADGPNAADDDANLGKGRRRRRRRNLHVPRQALRALLCAPSNHFFDIHLGQIVQNYQPTFS